jgi:metal-sulfur cluster biosynthetic enzyme/nitrite reductase/ring-hydroxylating ferredoxin subunit
MSQFVRVAKRTEIADPGRLLLEVEDRIVVLLRVGGEFFCLDDVCTHDGGPLSDGRLEDHAIACPRHGAKFDIRTGKALTMPATVDTSAHEVKVEGDDILIRLCEPSELASSAASVPVGAERELSGQAVGVVEEALNPMSVQSRPTTEIAGDQNAAGSASEGKITEDHVREELKKVIDPELFVNIVDLGLIYNVDLFPATDGKTNCKIDMTMTSPMCPAGPQMIQNSKQVLGQLPGMGEVEVKIVLDPPWTPDKMTQDARDQLGIF